MDEAELKAKWLDFTRRLLPVGTNIFGATSITITAQGNARPQATPSPSAFPDPAITAAVRTSSSEAAEP
jgi:hypothetical protein